MGFISRAIERRYGLMDAEKKFEEMLFGRASATGVKVSANTAMSCVPYFAGVRIIAETVGQLPLIEYRRINPRGKSRATDRKLYRLLHDEPNPEMTSFVFRETLMSHLLIWGNAYAQIIRDGAGRVVALYPLLPDKMQVYRDDSGELYYIYTKSSDENPNLRQYGQVRLSRYDVLHIPGLGFDGLVGYSPIAMAKNAVGISLACE